MKGHTLFGIKCIIETSTCMLKCWQKEVQLKTFDKLTSHRPSENKIFVIMMQQKTTDMIVTIFYYDRIRLCCKQIICDLIEYAISFRYQLTIFVQLCIIILLYHFGIWFRKHWSNGTFYKWDFPGKINTYVKDYNFCCFVSEKSALE